MQSISNTTDERWNNGVIRSTKLLCKLTFVPSAHPLTWQVGLGQINLHEQVLKSSIIFLLLAIEVIYRTASANCWRRYIVDLSYKTRCASNRSPGFRVIQWTTEETWMPRLRFFQRKILAGQEAQWQRKKKKALALMLGYAGNGRTMGWPASRLRPASRKPTKSH